MPEISDEQYRLFKRYQSEYKYRSAIEVKEIVIYQHNASFAVCPRCQIPMEREFQGFCDRCGQKLSWKLYDEGKIKIIGASQVNA